MSQMSPPLLGFPLESGLDGLSYHHYFRVTYRTLPTIKCYGHIPGFTQLPCSFESDLIRLCEGGWSGHIFQILSGVLSMKNHERAKCEAQSSRTGFLFYPPWQRILQRDILLSFWLFLPVFPTPASTIFRCLTWSLGHTTPVLKHFLLYCASCSCNLSHHHTGFLPFHLGSHSVIPCCPIFRCSIPNISWKFPCC